MTIQNNNTKSSGGQSVWRGFCSGEHVQQEVVAARKGVVSYRPYLLNTVVAVMPLGHCVGIAKLLVDHPDNVVKPNSAFRMMWCFLASFLLLLCLLGHCRAQIWIFQYCNCTDMTVFAVILSSVVQSMTPFQGRQIQVYPDWLPRAVSMTPRPRCVTPRYVWLHRRWRERSVCCVRIAVSPVGTRQVVLIAECFATYHDGTGWTSESDSIMK